MQVTFFVNDLHRSRICRIRLVRYPSARYIYVYYKDKKRIFSMGPLFSSFESVIAQFEIRDEAFWQIPRQGRSIYIEGAIYPLVDNS